MFSSQKNLIPNIKTAFAKNCSVCIKNPNLPADTAASHDYSTHYHCSSCKTAYQSVRDLYYHQCIPCSDTHLPGCWKCGQTFEDDTQLQVHVAKSHVDSDRIPCAPCDQTFTVISPHEGHTTSCQPEKYSKPEDPCN